MRTGLIYHAFDTVNGKAWVGQTWNSLEKRRYEHEYTAGKKRHPFYAALHAHGKDAFVWTVLVSGLATQKEMDDAEATFMAEFGTRVPNGYNIRPAGNNTSGWKCSAEHKRKVSLAMKGRKLTAEHRAKIAENSRNRHIPCSPEKKAKLSALAKARWAAKRATQ